MELPGAGLHLRPSLLAAGFRDDELRGLRRRGRVVTLRPGAYVPADDPVLGQEYARHVLEVHASVAGLGPGTVVSHSSAALLHGWDVWPVPERVHVTRNRRSGARVGSRVHLHAARLAVDEVVEVGGLHVTAPARTVVDTCRSASFESGVIMADAALRSGDVDRPRLARAVDCAARRPGNGNAARAVAFADARSESVGESRSRVAIARCRLPAPQPQFPVYSADGTFVGRSDFGWPDLGTVAEFDGLQKYGRLLRPGESVADAVVREKLREDAIRNTGLRVVRWIWSELDDFTAVAVRLTRAFTAH